MGHVCSNREIQEAIIGACNGLYEEYMSTTSKSRKLSILGEVEDGLLLTKHFGQDFWVAASGFLVEERGRLLEEL